MGFIISIFWALSLAGCGSANPYLGLSDEELYQYALEAFEEEEWSDAIEVLERLILSYPTFDRIIEARMYLARSFLEKGEYLSAASEFARFLDRYPGNEMARSAMLGRCRAYERLSPIPQRDQTYTLEALNACQDVVTAYPGAAVADSARAIHREMREKLARKDWLSGDFYFRRKLYDSAIIYFEDVVEEYPDTSSAPEALLRLYQAYTEIGWEQEADAVRERLLETYPDSEAAQSIRAVS